MTGTIYVEALGNMDQESYLCIFRLNGNTQYISVCFLQSCLNVALGDMDKLKYQLLAIIFTNYLDIDTVRILPR